LYGDGSSAGAFAQVNTGAPTAVLYFNLTTAPSVGITDILDYASTTKYKTYKTLTGRDYNGSGGIGIQSNLWSNTTAVNTVNITTDGTFAQYSQFALYGIKG